MVVAMNRPSIGVRQQVRSRAVEAAQRY